jgi:hypothetical protein
MNTMHDMRANQKQGYASTQVLTMYTYTLVLSSIVLVRRNGAWYATRVSQYKPSYTAIIGADINASIGNRNSGEENIDSNSTGIEKMVAMKKK